jgi:tripeptidyl-peptidase-1
MCVRVCVSSYGIDEALLDGIDGINTLLAEMGLRGVSVMAASGDSGAFLSDPGCAAFAPAYPASSPWLTSVGGSTLAVFDGPGASACPTEVQSSLESTASITGGGGFSALSYQRRPAYQDHAVQAYLNDSSCRKPTELPWMVNGRAYPDVTLLAHNYEIQSVRHRVQDHIRCVS